MTTPNRRVTFDQILVDLNTQCDFLLPGGALPVANRAEMMPRVRQLMNWARLKQVPVISSLEAHRHGESFRNLPPHCIDHTLGQKKLPFTLMPNRMLIMGDNTADVPLDAFRRFQQLIFTKRNADFLANPKADRIINSLSTGSWLVFGITATHCVKSVTLGLLARHNKVVVVRDACGYWSAVDGEHAFRQMEAKGALIVTTEEVVSGAIADRIKSHFVHFDAADDEDPLDVARNFRFDEEFADEHAAKSNGNGSDHPHVGANGLGNGNGHKNGKSHRAKDTSPKEEPQTELRPENVADFVPPHLIRRKTRPGSPKTRRH